MSSNELKSRLKGEVIESEGFLCGLFWNNPDQYNFYSSEKLNTKTFLNEVYGFYFGLGRYMQEKGVKVFDEITVQKYIKELNLINKYDIYGGYETIYEVMEESRQLDENLEAYYKEIKKYNLINQLVELFGEKVITNTEKYNYYIMSKEQLHTYWNDKVNKLAMDGDNKYDEQFLLKGLRKNVENWNINPSIGLPFYQSKKMTEICTGWDYGNVYIYGGFGGSGKTSLTFNKVIMSCIKEKEKLLVIANEQSLDEFQKLAITTSMGTLSKNSIKRQRLNEGEFTQEEIEKLDAAIDKIEELADGNDELITFVFMENYVMDDVKKLIRHYAARGIRRILIDTGKPSEGQSGMARWEIFTEDFKEIYKLARKNGGGLNLAVWVNVQLSDAALSRRFLNEHALGDSKKIKNEASVMFLGRHVWDDEFKDGKHELEVTNYVKDDFNGGYYTKKFNLERDGEYYLLFTSKNRRGQDNKTGQRVLVLKPNFNNNTWTEIGWTTVYDDKNY